MTDPLQLARECGADRLISNGRTSLTFKPEQIATLIDRVRAEAMREQREKDAAICKGYAVRHAGDDDTTKAQAWMMLQCSAAIAKQEQEGTK